MRWPLVTRSWADFQTDRADQLRAERDTARSERDAERAAKQAAIRQLAEADAANKRLHGRNTEITRRLEDRIDLDEAEYVKQLENRVQRLARGAARYLAEVHARGRRIQNLERRLDQSLGLDGPAITAGAEWQQRREDKQVRR